jgi:predicted DNA-binding ribbon-helix-helix protein
VKRSITIAGHRTSVFVDDGFWHALGEIAAERGASVAALVAEIDQGRGEASLSAAIRGFVLDSYRKRTPERTG